MSGKTALILDFGGVISRTLFEQHDETERILGLPHGTLRWRGPLAPETDPLWGQMEAGGINERDYWRIRAREVGALIGEDWPDVVSFLRRVRGDNLQSSLRPEALNTMRQLKSAGVKLGILSNELDLFCGLGASGQIAALCGADVVVDATYTGILKPDPRAYREALEALKVPADQAVFVDDRPDNVEGARRAGIAAVAFDVADPARSYRRVMDYFPQAN